jgi:hypothetical protein
MVSILISLNLWAKDIGGPGNEWLWSIAPVSDSGVIVAGGTSGYGAGGGDYLALRINSTGDILWAKTYGGNEYEEARSIIPTSDGGFVITGTTCSFVYYSGAFTIKINPYGDPEWSCITMITEADGAVGVCQTADGEFAITGSTSAYDYGNSNIFVIKLNSSGDTIRWARRFGGLAADAASGIVSTYDGGVIVAGYTHSFGTSADILVFRLNSAGDTVWGRTFGGTGTDIAYSLAGTNDGGCVVVGYTTSFSSTGDILVIKIGPTGNLEWAKTYDVSGSSESGYSIIQTPEGGYAVCGSWGLVEDFIFFKLTPSGDVEWARAYGGTANDWASSIRMTSDSLYVIGGYLFGLGAGNYDFSVIKVSKSGDYPGCVGECNLVSTDVNSPLTPVSLWLPTTSASLTIPATISSVPPVSIYDVCEPLYENVNEELSSNGIRLGTRGPDLYLFTPYPAQVSLRLYDAQGRLVQRLYDGVLASGGHTFNPALESKGVYIAVLRHQGGMKSLKIVR